MGEYIRGDVHVYDLEKCLQAIRVRNADNEETIRRLRAENRHLKEEYSKDEEIKAMQSKLDEMKESIFRGFPISKEEQDAIDAWMRKHDAEVHGLTDSNMRLKAGGAVGGRYSYHFLPTSIGVSGTVRCHCGAEFEFQKLG